MKYAYTGILQFPKGVTKNFNLINRVVYQLVSQPIDEDKFDDFGSVPPGQITPPSDTPIAPINLLEGRTTGFGDLYYVGLFSPKEGLKHLNGSTSVWGIGVDAGFPTATSDLTGTGKWSAGPSALYAYLGRKWKVGALVQHYQSFAGDSDRSDVSLTNTQLFYYYSISPIFSIGAAPNIIANWEQNSDNRWTVPLGLGFNTTTNLWKIATRFACEVHYSVIRPDTIPAPEWDVRLIIIPSMPSALFKWMD